MRPHLDAVLAADAGTVAPEKPVLSVEQEQPRRGAFRDERDMRVGGCRRGPDLSDRSGNSRVAAEREQESDS
jgi:hypothetical protein